MELWIILFILVVAISFFMAYQSMKDFQEGVQHTPLIYGVYLIKNPTGITPQSLNRLHLQMARKNSLISFETLFKGNKSAHVVFGPKEILEHGLPEAQLVELEDYTPQVDRSTMHVWEMELKDPKSFQQTPILELFSNMPELVSHEHFWWQVVLKSDQSKSDNNVLLTILEKITDPFLMVTSKIFGFPIKEDAQKMKLKNIGFGFQIRCVFSSNDIVRRRVMGQALEKLNEDVIIKAPKPLTSTQLFESYLLRSITPVNQSTVLISPEKVIELAGLKS